MAGFVPGRDHATLDALSPDQIRQRKAAESADQRAALDKENLANLERAQTGSRRPIGSALFSIGSSGDAD